MDGRTRDRLESLRRTWGERSLEDVVVRLLDGPPASARALYLARKAEVDAICRKHRVRRLVAFGSRARGDARPDSDLDLAVLLPPKADLFDLVNLKEELEGALGLATNLVTFESLRGPIKRAIEREGVELVHRAR